MPLKFKYGRKEDVPTDQAGLYVERNGVFFLDMEGAVDKEKLDEFRNNNIALQNQLKTFEGLDAAKARELLKKQQELEDGELIKTGDINKIVESRLAGFKTELETVRGEKSALERELSDVRIHQAAMQAATKRGVRQTAVPDLLARARGVFRLVDGNAVATDEKGKAVRYGKDGVTPLNFDEWVEELTSEAPHLFEPNSGGGAGLITGKNPWKHETWNLTEQGRLTRSNPTLAAQMKRAAGRWGEKTVNGRTVRAEGGGWKRRIKYKG